jgi:hypothetical protein
MLRHIRYRLRFVPLLIAIAALLCVGAAAAVAAPQVTAKRLPSVQLSRPHLPSIIASGGPFTVRGTLRPRHADGAQSVKIACYLQNAHGHWVFEKTVWATNHDLGSITRYVATVTLESRSGGPEACRLRAVAPADSQHRTTRSKWSRGDVLTGE